MQYYLSLQKRRYIRWIKTLGIDPILGIVLAIALFILMAFLLFEKTEWAKWVLLEIAAVFLFKIGTRKDLKLSRAIFTRLYFLKIRLMENLICASPFVVFLLFKGQWLIALILLVLAGVMVFINYDLKIKRSIPTPFKKMPWEFIVGFRKTFWLIPVFYFVLFKAIQVNNFNLGLAVFFAHFLLAMSFYVEPEKVYFVWIFKDNPKSFLLRKWKTCMLSALILTFPAFVVLGVFLYAELVILSGVYALGLFMLSSIIVAKYSAFPYQINLPQVILYAISLLFPVVLPVCMCLFYRQSIRKLKPHLE